MKLWPASLEQAVSLIREGKLLDIIEYSLSAHATFGASLNAYKAWDGIKLQERAEALQRLIATGADLGPMMGIPVSVKDLYGAPGLPTYAGSSQCLPDEWNQPGPVLSSLLSQMALVTGKTHTVEFAFGGLGVNNHWGTPQNPWASSENMRVPGGSSSGAGVSLLEGSAMLALGTDTAGSVRIPASFTGMVGLKTTFGRWSNRGIVPLSTSLDTPGILARSVRDAAFAFSVIDGKRNAVLSRDLLGLRIGIPENFFFDEVEPSIAALYDERLKELERAGALLVKVDVPGCDEVYEIFRQGGLAAAEFRSFLDRNFPERIASLDPVVKLRVESAHEQTAIEYLRRREELAKQSLRASALFATCDVIATPTVAISPPQLSELQDAGAYAQINMKVLRNTVIANLFGQCALSLPIGFDGNNMPVGLQLIAAPFAEEALLATGNAVETRFGSSSDILGTLTNLKIT